NVQRTLFDPFERFRSEGRRTGRRPFGLAGSARGLGSTTAAAQRPNSGKPDDEWVADWADRANVGCTDWTSQTGIAGGDLSRFGGNGGDAYNQIPAALFRGGNFINLTAAGVFKVRASSHPSATFDDVGFRCAR